MTPRQRNQAIAELRTMLAGMKLTDARRGNVRERLSSLVHARMREARARKANRRTAA